MRSALLALLLVAGLPLVAADTSRGVGVASELCFGEPATIVGSLETA